MVIINISYQTLQAPPPFAQAFTLKMSLDKQCLIKLDIEYLDRDEIDKDEIIYEGFTTDDDFHWEGELAPSWIPIIEEYVRNVKLESKSNDLNHWLHMDISGDNKKNGHVSNPEEALYLIQLIIQACFEKSGKEAPLHVNMVLCEKGQSKQYSIKAFFADRKFLVNGSNRNWDKLENTMAIIYENEPEEEPMKIPSKDGLWIDYNHEGIYYYLPLPSNQKIKTLKNILL